MPEKDLGPRNVNQDTVQIHLSEECSLTTSPQVVSSVRIHTCQSLSLSLSLPFVSLLSVFINGCSFPPSFFEIHMQSSVPPSYSIFSVQQQIHRLYICIYTNI